MLACAVWGQESKTYVYDVNGDRSVATESREVKTREGKTVVESVPSMNGGAGLNEQVEERVLEDTGASRIIERLITYGSGGRVKVRTEEKKQADGSSTVSTTRYRDDGNGSMEVAERSVRNARGGVTETLIERPGSDGSLAVVERQSGAERKVGAATEQTVITYRKDSNGSFAEAVREVSLRAEKNGVASETTDQYVEGQLSGRTLTNTRKAADGGEVREISVYGMTAPGQPTSDQPQLREQRR
ncbi:MAG: hypothetical protein NTY38_13205, partial [Acidobacteria bacterium]|nr:hypothetical protein [Acidobacteriota bacterium]